MDGVLLVDKPSGPTSFDVVRRVRRVLGERRIGHTGTLDPLASGLLVVCVGRATRLVPYLMEGTKRYTADVAFGEATDTDDATGEVIDSAPVPPLDPGRIAAAAAGFAGVIRQVPPRFSAVKKDGVAADERARRGEEVALEPREVRVDRVDVLAAGGRACTIEVTCGKGTYVRSLARDLAAAMGTVGHLTALRRTSTSGFDVDEAVPFDDLERAGFDPSARLIRMACALRGMPSARVGEEDRRAVADGRSIGRAAWPEGGEVTGARVALLDDAGDLVAIAVAEPERLRMERVFSRGAVVSDGR